MKQLASDGIEIAYLDEGKGPAVVICHCSSASHKEWLPLIETLKSDWRVLAPDFIGYGQSEPWPATEPFSIDADIDVLLAVAKKAKGPISSVTPMVPRLARSGTDPRSRVKSLRSSSHLVSSAALEGRP
jgi:pimeloyl-ACP methyl ester carboxylesterase